MSRTFFIGDIHGAHIALEQCLERSGFDWKKDTLITAGDICDGWEYVYECVEILLTINNRIDLIGNHDEWFRVWLQTGVHRDGWCQGGYGTAVSYLRQLGKEDMITKRFGERSYETSLYPDDVPPAHQSFFRKQHLYYKDEKDRLFVHAGFNRDYTLKQQQHNAASDFYWDRDLWTAALSVQPAKSAKLKFKDKFSEIFIGHTATTAWTSKEFKSHTGIIIPRGEPITAPMKADIIWNCDTGAGWSGKLTIMDVDTHEYWQSDLVTDIYGERSAR